MGEIRIAGTWRIGAAPPDVWVVVSDLTTWPQWWPAIREASLLDGDGHAPGAARLVFDTPAPLRPLVVELEVSERDPPSRLVVVPTRGPLGGTGDLEVAAADGDWADGEASEIRYDLRLRVRSLLFKPLEPVLAGATRAGGRDRLRRAGDDLAALVGATPGPHDP